MKSSPKAHKTGGSWQLPALILRDQVSTSETVNGHVYIVVLIKLSLSPSQHSLFESYLGDMHLLLCDLGLSLKESHLPVQRGGRERRGRSHALKDKTSLSPVLKETQITA